MGRARSEQSVEVAAPRERCFAVLVDYDAFPAWQDAMRETVVHERDAEGRGSLVEFVIDARVRAIRYTLRYRYEPPGRITWRSVGGDVRSIDGEMLLEPGAAAGATRATYRLEIDPGLFVPGPVRRRLSDELMRRFMHDLRRRAEAG
jgi:polyketide cyclase/dehydrase/lipid transport protein